MADTPTLWGLHYSPWTDKARWALDHHRVRYRYREYLPMLGEPALRWRARSRPAGRPASVPLYVDDAGAHTDSNDIARRAETVGSGAPLFPSEHEGAIVRWADDADVALQAARALVVAKTIADPEAQVQNMPGFIPRALHRPLKFVARRGAQFIGRKYDTSERGMAEHERKLDEFLDALAAALADDDYLLGGAFTYADICAAVVVNAIDPPPHLFEGRPAVRATWKIPALLDRHAARLAWRDAVTSKHRDGRHS